MKKALIAMSGGVDSSVSALLLKRNNTECLGVMMRLNDNCKSDLSDAKEISEKLDIYFFSVDYRDLFDKCVIDKFVKSYINGCTPNPCIDCNRYMKFGALYKLAFENNCDTVVTGHYAIVEYDLNKDRYLLKKAKNEDKDQSYVLYSLTQEQLAHTYFPLGYFSSKDEIRKIAEDNGLINSHKKDSQDICFVKDGDYVSFIEDYTGKKYPQGNFIDENGNILGKHNGIIRYTIGQGRGLGIALGKHVYVKEKNSENNTVTLCDNDALFSRVLYADNINLISVDKINEPMKLKAKIRYKHKEQSAVVTQLDDDLLKIEFDEPQRAVAKGQSVVIYDGDIVVGGGTII